MSILQETRNRVLSAGQIMNVLFAPQELDLFPRSVLVLQPADQSDSSALARKGQPCLLMMRRRQLAAPI